GLVAAEFSLARRLFLHGVIAWTLPAQRSARPRRHGSRKRSRHRDGSALNVVCVVKFSTFPSSTSRRIDGASIAGQAAAGARFMISGRPFAASLLAPG